MADNNFDYNNQMPPAGDNRPDYSYNWNGSEHNNKGGKGFIKGLIAVLVIICVIAFAVTGILIAQQHD